MRTFNERMLIESVHNIQSNKILNNSFNFSHNQQKYKLSEYLHEIFYIGPVYLYTILSAILFYISSIYLIYTILFYIYLIIIAYEHI